MRIFHLLLFVLLSLLVIILLTAITPVVQEATGVAHPDYPGMFIGPANTDMAVHTRWLGYLFGLGIICLFGTMLFIGNRKNGQPTVIAKWIGAGLILYVMGYTAMVISHWAYSDNDGGAFFTFLPQPTAWMIFVVWFIPLIITLSYVIHFDKGVISEEEVADFHKFLEEEGINN